MDDGRGELNLSDVIFLLKAASSKKRIARVEGREVPHKVWKFNVINEGVMVYSAFSAKVRTSMVATFHL